MSDPDEGWSDAADNITEPRLSDYGLTSSGWRSKAPTSQPLLAGRGFSR